MGEPSLPFVSRKTRLSLNLRKVPVSTATDGNTKVTYHLERRLKIHGVRVSQHFGAHAKSHDFLTWLQRLFPCTCLYNAACGRFYAQLDASAQLALRRPFNLPSITHYAEKPSAFLWLEPPPGLLHYS